MTTAVAAGSYEQLSTAYTDLLAAVRGAALLPDEERAAEALANLQDVYDALTDTEPPDLAYADLLVTIAAVPLPADFKQAADSLVCLREVYVALMGEDNADHPAMGCCGCESWFCDVITEAVPPEAPYGEAYCWACVPDLYPGVTYTVLPGREKPAATSA